MTNDQRIKRVVSTYGTDKHADALTRAVDLMTDLRHFCKHRGIDFAAVMRVSQAHFDAESTK